jgi:hypothetical protein
MTVTPPYVDIILDGLAHLTSLVDEFDEALWLLLSDAASTLDPQRRRTALVTARAIAQTHARGPLLDHATGKIRWAARHNLAIGVRPDHEIIFEVLDCATTAMVVCDLTADQHVAVLTEVLYAAISQASVALQAAHRGNPG